MRAPKLSVISAFAALVTVVAGLAFAESPSPTPTPQAKDEKTGTTLRELLSSVFSGFDSDSEQAEDEAPAGLESDATDIITPEEMIPAKLRKEGRPWQAPDYNSQDGVLGWSPSAFEVPKGLESRVQFWFDVYTKYTTDQGILHDRTYFEIVYEVIDFGPIMRNKTKNIYQKAHMREKLVNERRKAMSAKLARFAQLKGPETLSGDDLRLWKLFEGVNDPKKFKEASDKKHIRFQLGQKDRFSLGIFHAGRYIKSMEKIFRDERLPIELTRLPFVESSFNINARSKVGASGIWQFMPRSARPYLKVGRDVDERNDPLKATRASARLLKQNYQMLQSWPLAITAYNHGPTGVKKIVDKMGTRDIVRIVDSYQSRTFGFASENFYACFLAALLAEKQANLYYGEAVWGPEIDVAEIRLRKSMTYSVLKDFFDGDKEATDLANPHLMPQVKKGRTSIPQGAFVRVPTPRKALAEDYQAKKLDVAKLGLYLKERPLLKPGETLVTGSGVAAGGNPVSPGASPTPQSDK